jgi:hypothetical protein
MTRATVGISWNEELAVFPEWGRRKRFSSFAVFRISVLPLLMSVSSVLIRWPSDSLALLERRTEFALRPYLNCSKPVKSCKHATCG